MEVGPKTSNFWLLARALGEFVKGEGGGLPPLSGEVRRGGAGAGGYADDETRKVDGD